MIRAAGTKSGVRVFESHIGNKDNFFYDWPQRRVIQHRLNGLVKPLTEIHLLKGCDIGGGGGASRSYDPFGDD